MKDVNINSVYKPSGWESNSTNSWYIMTQSHSWTPSTHSTRQEIFRWLSTENVHYLVLKSPTLVPILSQMNSFHPHGIFKIHFNTVHSSMPNSTKNGPPGFWLTLCIHFSSPPCQLQA
jgi:hypothetical protein